MALNFLKNYIERSSKADVDKALGRRSFITTTEVVQTYPSRMTVAKIGNDVPWLTLQLVFGVTAPGGSVEKSGQLVLTRDEVSSVLSEFDATELAALTNAKAAYVEAQAQLLAEILPSGHAGRPRVADAAPKTTADNLRRFALGAALFISGGVVVIALSLLFGPKTGPSTAGVDTSASAQTLASLAAGTGGQPAVDLSQAPAAWAQLPEDQKRVLMQAAQRFASGNGDVNLALVAALADMNKSNAVKGGTGGRTAPLLSPEEGKKIAASPQIRTSQGGTVFYAFVDPMCSACQHLERQIKKLDAKFNFVALPVAFQGGGRDMAASALCSKDKVTAWASVSNAVPVDTKPCDEGYKQVEANNALFLSMGFNATPTMIAPNGKLAQGSAETAQLAAWLESNSK